MELSHPPRTVFWMEANQEVRITCANGIKPHLLELEQHSTYRDLLASALTRDLNEWLLSSILEFQGRIPTHLVRSAETTLERRSLRPDRPILNLPGRQCTGPFDAGTHRLETVWSQDGWAPPIDPVVIEQLHSLDIMAIAFDEVSAW
jgi:hypothetical protein